MNSGLVTRATVITLGAMADITNDFAWSHSRARAFDGCPRAYWFGYYGYWDGWSPGAPARTRDAYVQKKLTSIPMWVGTRVHRAAEEILRAARAGWPVPTANEAVAQVRAQAQRDVADSRSGAWLARPAKRVGFVEHYYGVDVAPEAWAAAIDEVGRQVQVLFDNRVFRRLLAVSDRIRELEDFKKFDLGDVPVIVVLDVLVHDDRGGAVIVDWKTGEHHDDGEIGAQLGVYGLYATRVLGVPVGSLSAMHVNLRHGTQTTHAVGPDAMLEAERAFREGAVRMRAKLVDVEGNVAREDDFSPRPEGHPGCTRCNFRGVCGRA